MTRSASDASRESVPVLLRLSRAAFSIADTVKEIHRVCDRVEDAGRHGVLIVHIQDSARELSQDSMDMPLHSQWERALKRIETVRVPTVCIVEGNCFGLMLEVLLCTDYRIATPRLELGLARVAESLWPGMAIHRLASQLGVAQARAMVLFDAPVRADDALRVALVQEIVSDPMARGHEFVASLASGSVQDASVRRQLLLEGINSTHESVLGSHMAACDRTLRRPVKPVPAAEAVAALYNT